MDCDGGVNVERKRRELVNAGGSGSVDLDLAVSFHKEGWTKSLKKLSDVHFQMFTNISWKSHLLRQGRVWYLLGMIVIHPLRQRFLIFQGH